MKQLTPIQIKFHQMKARISGGITSLFDIWALFIRVLASSVGIIFNISRLLKYDTKLSGEFAYNKLDKYSDGEKYNFNGIYLPYIDKTDYGNLYGLHNCIKDTFSVFLLNNDDYSSDYVDKIDKRLPEGSYCYKNDNCDITIHNGDVVLDLGAWIGDFSAYACHKGAIVYAFEPAAETRTLLKKTVLYNKHTQGKINIVPYAVGDENKILNFFKDMRTAQSTFLTNNENNIFTEKIEAVKLDDWVNKENIKVDFIKADIEGFERNMLKGAVNILKTQQPVLSLCTYHLPDDPKVMKDIILSSNPNYKIIQRRMKMFAYVPNLK